MEGNRVFLSYFLSIITSENVTEGGVIQNGYTLETKGSHNLAR